MNTIQYLTGPEAAFYWPGIISGVVLAVICSLLSPLVVLRRMAFIGQGVSHAAFGGIGVAAVLGLGGGGTLQFGVVAAFCVLAALLISRLESAGAETGRQSTRIDTAIGIVLAGSMACGVLLTHAATRLDLPRSGGWEQILFGSILAIGWGEMVISVVIGVGVAGSLWLTHRHMTFWAFEPQTAIAFGVRGSAMRYLLVVLLAAAVVITMKLVGVVLATALLVTPAATALHLSERWDHVRWLSIGAGLLGTVGCRSTCRRSTCSSTISWCGTRSRCCFTRG